MKANLNCDTKIFYSLTICLVQALLSFYTQKFTWFENKNKNKEDEIKYYTHNEIKEDKKVLHKKRNTKK